MAKLMCAKCGGKVKMANGGTTPKKILAKAPVNMYGIPQENLGTSSQYGFAKKGGKVGSKTLKPIPADKVGLSKLPTSVRNKMGYMKIGGSKKK